jgi:hypothetical protein
VIVLLSALAVAAPAKLPKLDLDGDGKPELIRMENDSVILGQGLEAGYCDMGGCEISAFDIDVAKPGKDLQICVSGPRDDVSCSLYTYAAGQFTAVDVPDPYGPPSAWTSRGNGVLLGYYDDRWFRRVEKFDWKDGKLHRVAQPFYAVADAKGAPWTVTIDGGEGVETLRLLESPETGGVVAVPAEKSQITVLLESAPHFAVAEWDWEKRWFLVRTATGLVGWAKLTSIINANEELRMRASAG